LFPVENCNAGCAPIAVIAGRRGLRPISIVKRTEIEQGDPNERKKPLLSPMFLAVYISPSMSENPSVVQSMWNPTTKLPKIESS
jgi:hypothetical protein